MLGVVIRIELGLGGPLLVIIIVANRRRYRLAKKLSIDHAYLLAVARLYSSLGPAPWVA